MPLDPLKNAGFRDRLSAKIRLQLRDALYDVTESETSPLSPVLLRGATAVLSLLLAASSASLNREVTTTNRESPDHTASDVDNLPSQAQLAFAENLRSLAFRNVDLPTAATRFVSQFVTTYERDVVVLPPYQTATPSMEPAQGTASARMDANTERLI